MSRNLCVVLVVLLALLLPVPSAHAAGSIMTCNEAGLLSALAGGGNVTFYVSCTITVTSPIHISADTTIDGNGYEVTLSAVSGKRVFIVESGARLDVVSMTFRGPGSGILIDDGILTVTTSTFTGLTASADPAVTGSGYGAAIDHIGENGWVAVNYSMFRENEAPSSLGGAIFAAVATTKVTNSTFYGNTAGDGGAIRSNGVLTVINSTFYGNQATNGAGAGGGISFITEAGKFTLKNSILSMNSGGNCSGTLDATSVGNLSWPDTTCGGINANPQLGTPKYTGGRTETMALLCRSPAVDKGDPSACAEAGSFDQRGFHFSRLREGDGYGTAQCDIGAVEKQGPDVCSACEIPPTPDQEWRCELTEVKSSCPTSTSPATASRDSAATPSAEPVPPQFDSEWIADFGAAVGIPENAVYIKPTWIGSANTVSLADVVLEYLTGNTTVEGITLISMKYKLMDEIATEMGNLVKEPCGSVATTKATTATAAAPAATSSDSYAGMHIHADHELTNHGHIYNFGAFNNEGKTTNSGVFDNFGTVENTGTFTNTGHLYNQCGGTTTGAITGTQPEPSCYLAVIIRATEPGYSAVGNVIHYDYWIINYYPYRLFDIKMHGLRVPELNCPDLPGGVATGASFHCYGSYTIQPADLDAEWIVEEGYAGIGPNQAGYATGSMTLYKLHSPVINFAPFAPDGSAGWYKSGPATSTVTATTDSGRTIAGFGCTDDLYGTETSVTGLGTASVTAGVTVTGSGVHTVTCMARGSDDTLSSAQEVAKIDTGAPQVSLVATAGGASYTAGTWSGFDVALDYTCSDAASGVATCPPDETLMETTTGVGGTATDVAGNAQSITFGDVKIDEVLPDTSLTGVPDNGDTSATFTFTGTDAGGSGLAGFWCQLNSDAPARCDGGTVTYGVGNVGYTFTVWAIDGAGNADEAPATWKRSAPVVAIAAFHPNGDGWFKVGGTPARSTATASYPGGTIEQFTCTDTFGPSPVTSTSGIGTANATVSLSVTGDGVHTLTCMATGGDGVVSALQKAVVRIDTQPPQVSLDARSNGQPYTAGTWTRYDVSLDYTCTDSGSGIKLCPGDKTFASTNTAVSGSAKDKAGNQTIAVFGDVMIDKTPPTTAWTGIGHPGSTSTNPTATFAFRGDDGHVGDGSGVGGFWCRLDAGAAARCDSGTVSYDVDLGAHTFAVWAVDVLGNEDATPLTWAWTRIAPVVSIDPFAPNGSNGWFMPGGTPATSTIRASYLQGTIASIECTDTAGGATVVNPSGLGTSVATATLSVIGDGVHTVTCTATGADAAVSAAQQVVVKIDTVPPSISPPTATANGLPYTAGAWTKDDVSLAFTCGDDGSGVAGCGPDRLLTEAVLGAGGSAVDAAGNPRSTAFGDVKIDKTAPDTSITEQTFSPDGGTASFDFEASDGDGSGVAGYWCKLDTGNAARCDSKTVAYNVEGGDHTFRVWAIDAVGNEEATPATHTWTSTAPCTAPGQVNGLLITVKTATNVKLEWSAASNASQYETWTAHDEPYFDPAGITCASPVPYSCAVSSALSHEAADQGSPGVIHSYLVRAVNGCGQTSAVSTRAAVFEFALVPGE